MILLLISIEYSSNDFSIFHLIVRRMISYYHFAHCQNIFIKIFIIVMNTIDMMYSKSDTFNHEMIISMISHSDFRSEEILYTIMNFENHIDRILSIYVYKVNQFEKYFNTYS